MIKIYVLIDPETNLVRYVGKTKQNLNHRLYLHTSNYRLNKEISHKNSWIKSLKSKNLKPIIEVIDIIDNNWQFWEMYWISQFKTWGFNLVNMTNGGEGCEHCKGKKGFKHTESTKKKISIANSRPKSEQWKQNAKEAMKLVRNVPIIQYSLDNIFIKRWDSVSYAADFYNDITGSKRKNITACCRNKRKSAYGFIWKYEKL